MADLRTAPPAPKRADLELLTPEHRAWRKLVITRAGGRCEWIEDGRRCKRCEADGVTLFADHKIERRDGGAMLDDPHNGMALCGKHHTEKTVRARARRQGMAV
jgi:5-methylcytosine-specific restriction enzyme A